MIFLMVGFDLLCLGLIVAPYEFLHRQRIGGAEDIPRPVVWSFALVLVLTAIAEDLELISNGVARTLALVVLIDYLVALVVLTQRDGQRWRQ